MDKGARTLHATCIKLVKDKKFAEAIALLTKNVEKRSDLVRPLTLASTCCMRLGRYEEAGDLAAAGITLDPSNAPAWYNAALSLRKLGKPSEAQAVLRQAPERVKARAVLLGSRPHKMDELAFLSFQTREPSKLVWEGLDTSTTPEAMRNLGWQEWKHENYESSLHWWKSLIHSKASYIGNSLLVRSVCNLQYEQNKRALMDVTTAMMLDPVDIGDLHLTILSHRQTVLKKMELYNAAQMMASFASKRSEYVRQKEFEARSLPQQERNSPAPGTTWEDEHHKDMHGARGGDVHEYGLVESMMRALPEAVRREIADERVMPLHEEFASGPTLAHCNTAKGFKWLQSAYVNCSIASKALKTTQMFGLDPFEDTEMIRRLSPDPVASKEWWNKASIGDISTRNPHLRYPDDVYQTFSNVTPKQITLRFGEKHVAVGYVDMGILLWANILGDESAGPIEFVGFEMSAYATSRTHVLAQMLRDGASVESILQVGYSSGWSFTCLKEFKEAVDKVLDKQELCKSLRKILGHWKHAPNISLLEAQERWHDIHDQHGSMHANVVQSEDRLEVMHYMLSGRLLQCDVGSITMFGNPPEIPHTARGEYAYWILSPEELGENYSTYGSIMGVVVGGLRKRITKLRELMQRGLVSVDLELRVITAQEPRDLKDIRALGPSSMSWSNVGDSMVLKDFHTLVRKCSSKHTVHHVHSMNWIKEVKGAFLVDYAGIEKRITVAEHCYKVSSEYMRSSIGEGIFHIPPIASPHNVAHLMALRFSEKWLHHFVTSAGPNRVNVKDTAVSRYTPLMANPTLYISFTCLDL